MISGILVVISGQMSLKIVDFYPAKVISNSRLLAKRKKTSTPTPSKGLSNVKEFASEKKNTAETELRILFQGKILRSV